MGDCLFCRIVDGTIPAKIVYEDEYCLAFTDINPQARVHVLVIPRRHVVSLAAVGEHDAVLLGHLLVACAKVAREQGVEESGYRVVANTGQEAGQSVFHLHFHVLGGRHLAWPPG
ncbi:MAG: histidine triad nucleotide-binding protein [Nitrospirales bacterium]|nr:histidine triad nucleotide-binding protein [Nitrospirales bacterium]